MSAIDLSSYFGLGAISLLTLNILIGLLLSTKYNPVRRWPHRHIDTLKPRTGRAWHAESRDASGAAAGD